MSNTLAAKLAGVSATTSRGAARWRYARYFGGRRQKRASGRACGTALDLRSEKEYKTVFHFRIESMRATLLPTRSDSVISAATALANDLGVPWLRVRRFYMALQEGNNALIPKSRGKQVWGAKPEYVARLLIALAGTMIPSDAQDVVRMMARAERSVRGGSQTFESELCRLLRQRAMSQVVRIDITPQLGLASIELKGKGANRLRFGAPFPRDKDDVENLRRFTPAAVHFTGTIVGGALVGFLNKVRWSDSDFLPTGAASDES